jgi:integrase
MAQATARRSGVAGTDLIFCTRAGGPLNPSNIARVYEAIVKRSDVRRVRFHDLRHTHATWLLKADVPVKVVSERLGHPKISITLDTYAHALPDMQDHAVEAPDAFMAAEQAS